MQKCFKAYVLYSDFTFVNLIKNHTAYQPENLNRRGTLHIKKPENIKEWLLLKEYLPMIGTNKWKEKVLIVPDNYRQRQKESEYIKAF